MAENVSLLQKKDTFAALQNFCSIMSISKAQIKRIRSLHQSKFRRAEQLFFIEGKKGVEEAMQSRFQVVETFSTSEAWVAENKGALLISETEMAQISDLHSPSEYFALIKMKGNGVFTEKGKWLYLDGIRDPGNLGTIIRTAHWFGWKGIVLSNDCVEWSNPKVIQSTMGSIFHIEIVIDDNHVLETLKGKNSLPIWGACLEGEALAKGQSSEDCILVIGSESHGIRPDALTQLTHRVTIPSKGSAESLNAAIATAIILYEWS